MGYVSDWDQWARAIQAERDAYPDCTSQRDCPAGSNPEDHVMDCPVWRRAWWVGRGLAGLAVRA